MATICKMATRFSMVIKVTMQWCPVMANPEQGKPCLDYMGRVMRKWAFCICKKKDADQLCGNRTADQCLCFHTADSAIPLLPKSGISILQPYSVVVQHGLSRTWSETPKTGFLTTRLIFVDQSPSSTMIS